MEVLRTPSATGPDVDPMTTRACTVHQFSVHEILALTTEPSGTYNTEYLNSSVDALCALCLQLEFSHPNFLPQN